MRGKGKTFCPSLNLYIMCLYPRFYKNPHYKKEKGNICRDERVRYVPIGCGQCIECRRQKAREWRIRLMEELKHTKYAYFVTLTFDDASIRQLAKAKGNNDVNEIATIAVRRFLERWRKKYKKSLRHWLITELGHEGTERIHLHGVIFPHHRITKELLQSIWQYGWVDNGKYCNERTINYIVKYVTKIDADHKTYIPKILCSAGLGSQYITDTIREQHAYIKGKTNEMYRLPNGARVPLPIYYRNKLFTQTQREQLWIEKIEADVRWVKGVEIRNYSEVKNTQFFYDVLTTAQKANEAAGFGSTEWKREHYNFDLQQMRVIRNGFRNIENPTECTTDF